MKANLNYAIFLLSFFTSVFFSADGRAEWSSNPHENEPICLLPGDQGGWDGQQIITDGKGGAIIAWLTDGSVSAQRIDADGNPAWQVNGVLVPGTSSLTMYEGYWDKRFSMIADGKGGAIFAWEDNRNGNSDIYSQKLDATGAVAWSRDGVAVAKVFGTQSWPEMVSDGNGGAFLVWRDQRIAPSDSFIQWLGDDGKPRWQSNGVNVAPTAPQHQYYPRLIANGQGGVIVTWMDDRRNVNEYYHFAIYAQKFNTSGQTLWKPNGVLVSHDIDVAYINPEIVSDGAGGAIIVWRRNFAIEKFVAPREVYIQRINSNGEKLWAPEGMLLTDNIWTSEQWTNGLVSDKNGGAFFTWSENNSLKVQHINAAGQRVFGDAGLNVIENTYNLRENAYACENGKSGLLIAWEEHVGVANVQAYAQQIGPEGSRMWGRDGVLVSATPGRVFYPKIISDAKNGAILTWSDNRKSDFDIFAQKIFPSGLLANLSIAGLLELLLLDQ